MSERNVLTKALTETVLTRRSFLKWSAALGGTAALAGGLKYGLQAVESAAEAAGEAVWQPVACWHNCGGRCANYALVQDGVVIRQKTDDLHPDSPDYPQQRGCSRGRSQRRQVFGPDRLKYPMKRAHWAPGGGQRELRGADEWVRISWDEALDLVAAELKRIKDSYGNASILLPRTSSRLINAFGGGMDSWGVTSEGAWPQVRAIMTGNNYGANDRMQFRKAKLVVLWGANPAVSSGGNPAYNHFQAKKAGAKYIIVTPELNHSAMPLADEWIPVRPSTDTALLLGMAHYMITNNLQDQDFLDKYTSGFDAYHMPPGSDYSGNFRDYVLGTYDGVPKTPEWASAICGTPVETIRSFAQQIATTKPMTMVSSSAPARTANGEEFCQAFLTVGWMTGNVGFEGAAICHNYHNGASYGGPALVRSGGSGLKAIPNPMAGGAAVGYGFSEPTNTKFQAVAYEELWDAILNNQYHATVRGVIPCDIRAIYRVQEGNGGNALNQASGALKGIAAYRKLEFVVVSDIVLSTTAKYADIVLPTTTPWEHDLGGFSSGNPEMVLWYNQITEPLFEARDVQWIEKQLAPRLGLDPEALYPFDRKQQVFNQLLGATVATRDGKATEKLLTITAEDLAGYGVTGEAQDGRVHLADFLASGVYQVPRAPDDAFTYIAARGFRKDPAANPLKTATGKYEIYSEQLAQHIANYGFSTIAPIAKYTPPAEGYEGTFSDYANRVKGDFPLQICNPHNLRRSHSVFDNIIQLRRAFPQEVWINPLDAQARGIQTNDTILVSSPHGRVIRHALVTPRIMPGVITLSEGAWVQMDEALGIDRAGCTNVLCGARLVGQGQEPWNTCIAQVEKYTGPALEADYTWPQRIPIKEA
ncbi:MAG: molybdopterin-dependent oxidoreductase [Anaerolineales bacterium]|nr:molybdopterin-dependent oxidoreductase [Anaerolineales bacterium]